MANNSTALIQVPPTEIEKIKHERNSLLVAAQSLVITDQASYQQAGQLALSIANGRRIIIDKFADPKKKAHDAHKSICALEKECLDALAEPDRITRAKLTAWDTEQQRKREQQEQEARDRARREAEERQLQQAIAAEERGDNRTAEFLMKVPVIPEAIEMPAGPQRLSGVTYVEKWTYEVKDESLIPREFLMVNESKLRKHVELMRESANVPGVEVFPVKSTRIGGRIAEPKPVQSAPAPAVEEVNENIWG
jgi:hypothetical protein